MIDEKKERELYDAYIDDAGLFIDVGAAWEVWLAAKRHADEDAEKLRTALAKAAADLDKAHEYLEDWGLYVGEYFREKHDLTGDLTHIKQCADESRNALRAACANMGDGKMICTRCRKGWNVAPPDRSEQAFGATGWICQHCVEVEQRKRCSICRKPIRENDRNVLTITAPMQSSMHVRCLPKPA